MARLPVCVKRPHEDKFPAPSRSRLLHPHKGVSVWTRCHSLLLAQLHFPASAPGTWPQDPVWHCPPQPAPHVRPRHPVGRGWEVVSRRGAEAGAPSGEQGREPRSPSRDTGEDPWGGVGVGTVHRDARDMCSRQRKSQFKGPGEGGGAGICRGHRGRKVWGSTGRWASWGSEGQPTGCGTSTVICVEAQTLTLKSQQCRSNLGSNSMTGDGRRQAKLTSVI